MQLTTRSLCETCRSPVPAGYTTRDGNVYLQKQCPQCGLTEALISNDAATWQGKRDLWQYDPSSPVSCTLDCHACSIEHDPTIVFVDVTNRCNMNCPICIANIKGMGFEFHPPLAYFEKLFQTLGKLKTKPLIELFGGEPTLRDDLLDIIKIARNYGMKSRIVTNGLRLADEEYCKKLCETGVRFRIAFDGRDAEVYRRLRKNAGVYEKKVKALENLRKHSRRKNAILCCAARRVNEHLLGGCMSVVARPGWPILGTERGVRWKRT